MELNNKRIAKNTAFLYFRQVIVLVVSLYTSRVILQTLGITDFGIYGAVGGVVGFMGFLNEALATSSSRYLTYSLGEGDLQKSIRTFGTTLTIHIGLGVVIALLAETVGLWLIYNKLIISPERLSAAIWAFQFSVLTIAIGVSQVPYTAVIIAHEKMNIHAYVGLVTACARLAIALLIQFFGADKLIFYAFLLLVYNIGVMAFYRIYCSIKFPEARFRLMIDKSIFRAVANFSAWNLLYNFAYALNGQGLTVLMSMFFNPAIVAAQAISVKVNTMTTQFIGNFRQAANPQIVKLHAAKEYDKFKELTFNSAKYSYFIMWVMTLPICILAQPLMKFWLGDVPPYTVIFVQLVMIDSLFWLFDCSFNQGIIATGEFKKNAIYSSLINIARFPIVYLFFKIGLSPVSSFIISIFFGFIIGCLLKPYLLHKQAQFSFSDFWKVYKICIGVTIVSSAIPIALSFVVDGSSVLGFVLIGAVSVSSALVTIYFLGIGKQQRKAATDFMLKKLNLARP